MTGVGTKNSGSSTLQLDNDFCIIESLPKRNSAVIKLTHPFVVCSPVSPSRVASRNNRSTSFEPTPAEHHPFLNSGCASDVFMFASRRRGNAAACQNSRNTTVVPEEGLRESVGASPMAPPTGSPDGSDLSKTQPHPNRT